MRVQTGVKAVLAVLALGCRAASSVPEPGAILLRLSVTAGATAPDELRVWVYDDAGPLWNDVRVPNVGALLRADSGALGTILVQPGAARGPLRMHVRGFAGGVRVADALTIIAAADRGQGIFEARLDKAVPADADGDDVPDAIDDCPSVADSAQKGCPASSDGAAGAGGGDGAAGAGGGDGVAGAGGGGGAVAPGGGDGAVAAGGGDGPGDASQDAVTLVDGAQGGLDGSTGDAGVDCGGGDACLGPGAGCTSAAACASGFCVDGVCCANACAGPCRSCNQPGSSGTCHGYVAGTDPENECLFGTTCDGMGTCDFVFPPLPRPNGALCAAAEGCDSGHCKDGVCCNTSCANPCETCATGICRPVTRGADPPECLAPMTCNPAGKCTR